MTAGLASSPVITANWEADSGDKGTVPLSGFRHGGSVHQVSHWALSRCIVWSVLTVSATCAEAVAQEPSDDSQWTDSVI